MKMYNINLIIALALLAFGTQLIAQNQTPLAKAVVNEAISGTHFQQLQVLEPNQDFKKPPELDQVFKKADAFQLNSKQLGIIVNQRPAAINLDFATNREKVSLQLVRHEVLTADFTLVTSEGDRAIDYQPGVYYRGIVNGDPTSMAAISFFDDEAVGVFSTNKNGDYVLGKIEGKNASHIGYYEQDMLVSSDFVCETVDPNFTEQQIEELRELSNTVASFRVDNCVNVYLELEYNLVTEKGGATGATNFITGLYNVVATLYQNESITTKISQIFTWTSADSYPTSSTNAALSAFRAARPNYNGDLAHLISRGAPSGGGVAYLNGLCNSYGYAYSYIFSSYSGFPTYSWSVNVVAHEMGHNIGSPHTHSCSWTGGAIDGCGPAAGYPTEGGCAAPGVPSNGGTVMSYCHLVSAGINFNNGFGPLPGNLMRSKVSGASCLSSCSHCASTLTLTGAVGNTQNFQASSTINSTQTLSSSANVDYKAGSLIILKPGFVATDGSDFRGYIGNCSGGFAKDGEGMAYEDNLYLGDDSYENASREPAELLEEGLRCFPNPFQESTTVEYFLAKDAEVRLTIHDINGRFIAEVVNEQGAAGLHTIRFKANGLAAGMYYARLQTNGELQTTRLIIMK